MSFSPSSHPLRPLVVLLGLLVSILQLRAAPPWTSDQSDGTYRNPLLQVDFPDPDCIRISDTYYAVCSSFNLSPGLPLMRSSDLVNWRLVGHALPVLQPVDYFSKPHRGDGVWAPSLRHHAGRFWIYYPDPDFGIYLITSEHFEGPWSPPVLVKQGKGLIDPCPLWDDDGRLYLIHGWAKSRAGIGNVLTLCELSTDGQTIIDQGRIIIDGDKLPGYRTLEGPKLYKKGDTYWVFAPAGGVPEGWQSVFRSKHIWGPYEDRIVLDQGKTKVNGPHQGAWVTTPDGSDWFLHFQDRDAFGRIPHLQPMRWRDDGWPVMGEDSDGDGRGQPVLTHTKPHKGTAPLLSYPGTDDFDAATLSLQWQWECNPHGLTHSLSARPGFLRLYSQPAASIWDANNLLSQPVQGPASTTDLSLDSSHLAIGDRAGLVIMGRDYTWLELRRTASGFDILRGERLGNERLTQPNPERIIASSSCSSAQVVLRLQASDSDTWSLSFSIDGSPFKVLGPRFSQRKGWWLGARVGIFCIGSPSSSVSNGYLDADFFRVSAPE